MSISAVNSIIIQLASRGTEVKKSHAILFIQSKESWKRNRTQKTGGQKLLFKEQPYLLFKERTISFVQRTSLKNETYLLFKERTISFV